MPDLPLVEPAASGLRFLEKVEHREGYETITLGSQRWHYYFCGVGINRARRHSDGRGGLRSPMKAVYDLVPRIVAARNASGAVFESAEEYDALPMATKGKFLRLMQWDDLLDTCALVVWTGLVPFYPAMSLDDVLLEMDMQAAADLQRLVVGVFARAASENTAPPPADNGQAETTEKKS